MKESYREGPATHTGSESCAVVRKGGGETLTRARAGRAFSRESTLLRSADAVRRSGRRYSARRQRETRRSSARSETPSMLGHTSRENREGPWSPAADGAAGRVGKACDSVLMVNPLVSGRSTVETESTTRRRMTSTSSGPATCSTKGRMPSAIQGNQDALVHATSSGSANVLALMESQGRGRPPGPRILGGLEQGRVLPDRGLGRSPPTAYPRCDPGCARAAGRPSSSAAAAKGFPCLAWLILLAGFSDSGP
jgi:hypothetical protein